MAPVDKGTLLNLRLLLMAEEPKSVCVTNYLKFEEEEETCLRLLATYKPKWYHIFLMVLQTKKDVFLY